jgi:hypothetical protein
MKTLAATVRILIGITAITLAGYLVLAAIQDVISQSF